MKVFNGLTMNKYLFLFLGLSAQGAVEYDFNKGIDITARTQVTGAHLNQLVDNASLRAGRGLVLITNDTPDTANNPRYTNYLWVDTAIAGSPTLKFYVAGIGWTNSLVGATITETNIANNAVTTAKLANGAVTSDKISSGNVGNLQLGGSAVTTDKISAGAITRGVIADGAVGTDQITNSAVTTAKIAASAVTSDKISTVDWLTITNLVQAGNLYPLLSLTNWTVNARSNNVLFAGPNGTNAAFKPLYETNYMGPWGGTFTYGQGYIQSIFHNLGYKPQYVSAVIEVTNAIAGYQIGDEIPFNFIGWSNNVASPATRFYPLTYSYNNTGITVRVDTTFWSNGVPRWFVNNGTTAGETTIGGLYYPTNFGNWKFYYR